ncbi:MAG: hypothetical protein HY234_13460 [Acidobacteria bacterium]|nr:hypothetical protein [Acidobacteriota bacterium]MBI3664044.1 hypothetical protein [Acidobacteriota bacterium]
MADKDSPEANGSKAPDGGAQVHAAESIHAPETKPATEEELQEVEGEMDAYKRSTLKWTRTMVLVYLLTAVLIGLQWYEMRSSSSDTHALAEAAGKQADAAKTQSGQAVEQTKKMAELVGIAKAGAEDTKQALELSGEQVQAAKRSAKAAEEMVRQTYESMRLVERAWVGPADLSFIKEPASGEKVMVKITLSNTGRTPAQELSVFAVAELRYRELPKTLALGDLGEIISKVLVVPNAAAFGNRETGAIKKEDFRSFEEGTWPRIYVYGYARYKTVFPGIDGETQFCRVWLPKPYSGFIGCPGHPDQAK